MGARKVTVVLLSLLSVHFIVFSVITRRRGKNAVYEPVATLPENLLLIDPAVLSCPNCQVSQSQLIHFATFSETSESQVVGPYVIHKAHNDTTKDFLVFELDGKRRAVRKFNTKNIDFFGSQVRIPENPELFLWEWNRGILLECANVTMNRTRKEKRVISLDFVKQMAEFRDLLIAYHVTPLLFSGSLLGWYRECSIIPHTTDVDFAIFREEHSEDLLNYFKRSKIHVLYWFLGQLADSFELTVYRQGIKIDLFYIYSNQQSSFTSSQKIAAKEKVLSTFPLLSPKSVCTADLLGRLMFIPCDTVGVITAEYGKQWAAERHTSTYSGMNMASNIKSKPWTKEEESKMVKYFHADAEQLSRRPVKR